VPDKWKVSERDNTIVKRRKEEVVDVLAGIKKATNFIDDLVKKETPNMHSKSSSLKVKRIDSGD